jgi:metal-dependent amidase/aminoacylase/carboxypeptidase family protein
MLEEFINYMKKESFDLWLSWHIGFDYDYLYNRIPDFANKISPISKQRYGHDEVAYPAGISICDYLNWVKKITLNKAKSYALNNISHEYLGKENVVDLDLRMTAEDFAYFSQVSKGCFYRLGTSNFEKGITGSLHHPKLLLDDSALELSFGLMSYIALKQLAL